jgi:hypothetical protein
VLSIEISAASVFFNDRIMSRQAGVFYANFSAVHCGSPVFVT